MCRGRGVGWAPTVDPCFPVYGHRFRLSGDEALFMPMLVSSRDRARARVDFCAPWHHAEGLIGLRSIISASPHAKFRSNMNVARFSQCVELIGAHSNTDTLVREMVAGRHAPRQPSRHPLSCQWGACSPSQGATEIKQILRLAGRHLPRMLCASRQDHMSVEFARNLSIDKFHVA